MKAPSSGAPERRPLRDAAGRISKLHEDLRRWGLWGVIHMRIMGRLHPFVNLSYAVARELGRSEVRQTQAGCSIRVARREDLTRASSNPDLQMSAAFVQDALTRGDICVAAFNGDDMVAYTWRAFSATRHAEGIWLCFRPPFRYGYKALTLPAWRGKHLQEVISPFSDHLCRERGCTMGIGFIETRNFASLASAKRIGNKRIGVVGYLCLAGRLFTFRSAGARNVGFGFSRSPDGG